MPVIRISNGIPLFSTKKEALSWAEENGLSGYHIHGIKGQPRVIGYMGGTTHSKTKDLPVNYNASIVSRVRAVRASNPNAPAQNLIPPSGSIGGSGGAGGGGGY